MSAVDKTQSWIGVDLDGTLAHYKGWSPLIGAPIAPMVERVKRWIELGERVKILTARGTGGSPETQAMHHQQIKAWCIKHLGADLEVTDRKDVRMEVLYDDRAVAVEFNTGRLLSPELSRR